MQQTAEDELPDFARIRDSGDFSAMQVAAAFAVFLLRAMTATTGGIDDNVTDSEPSLERAGLDRSVSYLKNNGRIRTRNPGPVRSDEIM